MKTYVGIDNGCTGSIGIINRNGTEYYKMPVKSEQNYTKAKGNITRVDVPALTDMLYVHKADNPTVLLERPMVNPSRFKATTSALRALEATLVCLEALGFPLRYIDSKEWQKKLLPKGLKGSAELKKASVDIGCRLFRQHTEMIKKCKDADGLLIAEYARLTL